MVLQLTQISSPTFMTPILLSLQVAIIASIIVFILGTLLAWWMTRVTFPFKVIVETIIMLPIVLPPTVIGFLLVVIFGQNSIIGQFIENVFQANIMFTVTAAVIASSVVALPLMYQSAKTGFLSIDTDIDRVTQLFGKSRINNFLTVYMPLAKDALITGAILSFARAIGEFGATLMFAGNIPGRTSTLPTAIYTAFQSGNMTLAWMWVITIVIISFLMLLSIRIFNKKSTLGA